MKRIREGSAEIFVPDESLTRASDAFYNPAMEHQRNVTIVCARLAGAKDALDPLAATGVRGIRLLKEAGVGSVVFNDVSEKAISLIEKNLALNGIAEKSYEVSRKDASQLFLEKRRFGFVDIDPFGSPVKYLRNVAYSLRKGSVLGVTATDSGALSGKFAEACFRRYGVFVDGTDFPKELGIRVLMTSVLQNLATHNMTLEPLYSHANHYFRILGKIAYGPERSLRMIRMVSYCRKCHNKITGVEKTCGICGGETALIGPLWTGKIQDRDFCRRMLPDYGFGDAAGKKEIMICAEEIDHPFYYDVHMLAKGLKKSAPKFENLISRLRETGFEASRTHLDPIGIKTDAGPGEIAHLI